MNRWSDGFRAVPACISIFSSVHIITLESNLTGSAPLKVTALEALVGKTIHELTVICTR